MDVRDDFVTIAGLISEPSRAKILWSLLDGRAYTAGELAIEADISPTSASNHLSKLLQADLVKVEAQGRHRYYAISRQEVAYAIESLANLVGGEKLVKKEGGKSPESGVTYCRTCYDHLAGYIGVKVAEGLIKKKMIVCENEEYVVTSKGWEWAERLGIHYEELKNNRRPIVRKCLDWSERKPHIAGQFGAHLLSMMLDKRWLQKVDFSRELILTGEGQRQLNDLLGLRL